ncbi:MAG: alpha/beta hydrolase [Hyphomicrobiales bacterium]
MPHFKVTDFTDAYANAPNIPNGDAWPEAWVSPAENFRATWPNVETDISYGDHERESYDLFLPEGESKGLFVFIHGGFWLKLDKSYWTHLAKGALERGYCVAIPSYPLCPEVRVQDISQSAARAVTHAASKVAGPIILSGHSAGGHLVTRLISEGSALDKVTLDRIAHVVSISGVHDLRPLLKSDLNKGIGLDLSEAQKESPALLTPLIDAPVTCWVGANERSEFVRQNTLLANIWRGLGMETQAVEEPDRHHFDIIDGLCDEQSPLVNAIFETK